MFKLSEKYEVANRILKCDDIGNSQPEINTIRIANSQICTDILRDISGSVLSYFFVKYLS